MTIIKQVLTKTYAVAFTVAALSSTAYAGELDNIEKAIVSGTPYIDVRFRYEGVDDAAFTNKGEATTIRTKVGYTTAKYKNIQAGVEFDNVVHGGSESYNDGENNNTSYPAITDAETTEVNHAWFSVDAIRDTLITIGRQPVNLDNQRFIGTEDFRQNDQSYDAITVINKSIPNATLVYGFVGNVNRIQGDNVALGNLDTATHIMNASYDIKDIGKITGYGYIIDLHDSAVQNLSSKTFGLRFKGGYDVHPAFRVLYTGDYAEQDDWADNPNDYSAKYALVELGLSHAGLTLKGGFETLEGNSVANKSFQTPLASTHKHNGWADKFQTTPTAGLEDYYVKLSYDVNSVPGDLGTFLNGFKLSTAFHVFGAEANSSDYGEEWDYSIERTFRDHYTVSLQASNFQADNNASTQRDTEKLWVTLRAKF